MSEENEDLKSENIEVTSEEIIQPKKESNPPKPRTRGEKDQPKKCDHKGRVRSSEQGKYMTKVCLNCGKTLKRKKVKKKS